MRRPGLAPTARRVGLEAAVLAPVLAAGLGLARLTDAPTAPKVLIPVVACVVTGSVVAALTRRVGGWMGGLLSLLCGALAVSLVSVWWFVGASTVWGLPTAQTVHVLGKLLSSAFAVIDAVPTPLSATPGVVLCAAAGAGMVAAWARALVPGDIGSAPGRAAGLALAPSAGLFVYTSLVSSGSDRVQATVGYLVAVLLYVIVVDRARLEGGARSASEAPPPARAARRAAAVVAVSAMAVGGAVVVPLAVSPALAGMRLHALTSSAASGSGGGGSANGDAVIAGDTLALVDELDGEPEASQSEVLFVAHSSVPTYWQVATLSSFDGLSWDPEVATLAAAAGVWPVPSSSLPALQQPTEGSRLQASVRVEHLQGSLVPVPPDTLSVRGRGLTVEPGIGVEVPAGVRPATYSVVALTGSLSPSQGGAPGAAAADLAPYVQMTPQPEAVVALAHRIVAGAHTPLAEALALAKWFDDGRFSYSLTAPAGGADALEQFLFHTRAGICQQFAGAYGVLARIDGLPTRIAVGFDAGTSIGSGAYQVTAADAHVWPEVYLGPASGWVSIEPTPLTSASTVAAGVVYGASGVSGSGPASPGVFQNPREARHQGLGSTASPTSSLPTSPTRLAARSSHPGGASLPLWLVMGLAVVAVLVLGCNRLRVAFDGLRSRAASPSAAVVVRWQKAERVLRRRGLGRNPAETMAEHASRVRAALGGASVGRAGSGPGPGAAQAFSELAALASRAGYSGDRASPTEADRARRLGTRVRAGLRGRRVALGRGERS
jgi:hypothetical protein